MAGQFTAMDPLPGRENMILYGRLRELRRQQRRPAPRSLIEQFDLAEAVDRQVVPIL